jgi:Phosphoesterase family
MKSGVIALVLIASSLAVPEGTLGISQAAGGGHNAPQHFDHVLIVVLENQSYVAAIKDKYLKQLADQGANFTDFRGVGHPSYPNYLAMISGSTFGIHGLFGDSQQDFPDDPQHKTLADFLDWRNYAENYPAKPGSGPYLYDAAKYARKHVPFLSFKKVQTQSFKNVVSVDTKDPHNAFITDVENSRKDPKDPKYKTLPAYMFYSPNMDDDGHDTNLGTASTWLKNFLENWFPPDARKGTLVVVTFDEGESPEKATNHIYTVFLGDMIKKGPVTHRYNHFDVLRTIEANFGLQPLNSDDAKATVIGDILELSTKN